MLQFWAEIWQFDFTKTGNINLDNNWMNLNWHTNYGTDGITQNLSVWT